MIDLGDTYPLSVDVVTSAGVATNCSTMVLTVTLPDGTTATPTLTNSPVGTYFVDYVPAQGGHYDARFVGTAPSVVFTDSFDVDASIYAVSLADMKEHLRITGTALDEQLRGFISAATVAAESWCGRTFRRLSVVEVQNGGGDFLTLEDGPPISITSVVENGVTLTAADYVVDDGRLYRRFGLYDVRCWTAGVQNVTVTYVGGMAAFPSDLRHALKELTRHLWETQRGNSGPSQGPDDIYAVGVGYTFPRRVIELLSPYDLKPTLVR